MRRIAVVLLIAFASLLTNANALHFVAYGDTRTNTEIHRSIIKAIGSVDPALVLHVGDVWDGYGAVVFKSILLEDSVTRVLLNSNRFLVARGNHETESELVAFSPSLVRHDSTLYSFVQGNCFFICLGMDQSKNLDWYRQQLASPESRAARWRFVFCHFPVYSTGAEHGAHGIPAFEALCDTFGVNAVFSGHDHDYERTFPIRASKAVSADRHAYTDAGTIYIVTGGGGAPLYPVGSSWWTAAAKSTYEFCDVQALDTSLAIVTRQPGGETIDSLVVRAAAQPPHAAEGFSSHRAVVPSQHR